ncbi:sigma-54 interaction domain-containing protein [Geosporobacter ferrireducens]|uniref:Sigma-54 factor interaction domain-containing protein n=1 Tax=Geosporobacter ferrireducens TaxID=1424294 RepID=A0A1D8GE63_9FIRM|nr:sigma 54-interacting transcriptional regulator [Geosporobacter ferrireducens]AOT69201.1 hypothetical protein Gferi_06260 [Geosporobacter ferrireducens]MTI56879.1 AAA family ATPase [Geosporobacter ferrireducens]
MFDNDYNVKDLLDINYIDGITMVDQHGKIVYTVRYNPRFDNESDTYDVLNKNYLEVYNLDSLEESTIYNCLKQGIPITKSHQTFSDYRGRILTTKNITIPIIKNGKILGAVELSKDITTNEDVKRKCSRPTNFPAKKPLPCELNLAQYTFKDITTQNKYMLENIEKAKLIADSSSPILIYGSTGTGKELFVQSIHNHSYRRHKPFIAQNCASIPETLMETTLFGSVVGAYTGASDTPGIFELADGGTLFLDELNSMPWSMQAKFLRVLQDGLIKRVGDTKYKKVDVRIIAAMNVDPLEALHKKLLRDDIFYRLSVISFKLLPLKDRKEDIMLLTNYFISIYNHKFNKAVTTVSKKVAELFYTYDWPGNVRELQHIIEAAMNITNTNTIHIDHLPIYITEKYNHLQEPLLEDFLISPKSEESILPLNEAIEAIEVSMIKKALKKSAGNMSKASKLLKVSRQTLQYKIDKYGLDLDKD